MARPVSCTFSGVMLNCFQRSPKSGASCSSFVPGLSCYTNCLGGGVEFANQKGNSKILGVCLVALGFRFTRNLLCRFNLTPATCGTGGR